MRLLISGSDSLPDNDPGEVISPSTTDRPTVSCWSTASRLKSSRGGFACSIQIPDIEEEEEEAAVVRISRVLVAFPIPKDSRDAECGRGGRKEEGSPELKRRSWGELFEREGKERERERGRENRNKICPSYH